MNISFSILSKLYIKFFMAFEIYSNMSLQVLEYFRETNLKDSLNVLMRNKLKNEIYLQVVLNKSKKHMSYV